MSFLRGGKEILVGTPWKTIWMEVSGGDVQLEEEYKPAVGWARYLVRVPPLYKYTSCKMPP